MDYSKLTLELLSTMPLLRKIKPQKTIDDFAHGEAYALMLIARQGGEVNPSEISQSMNVSAARIASLLNALEKKGLITRKIDLDNRRRILVEITEEGKKITEEQQKNAMEAVTKMLEFLGEHDAAEYVRIMKHLAEIPPDALE